MKCVLSLKRIACAASLACLYTLGLAALPPALNAQNTTRGVVAVSQGEQITPAVSGRYYALVIGIDDYAYLPKLKTAVGDAKAVAAILHDRYGFETTILTNPRRDQIVGALNGYRQKLDDKANLLIYYAGHGSYDKEADKTYWLPVDAKQDDTTEWIMADDITTAVKVIAARHVLIVADSCYSGGLTREINPEFTPQEQERYIDKMLEGKSRTIMSSGALEPVSDQGGAGHSVFAAALLKGLSQTSDPVFSAETLFQRYVRVPVAGKSEQTPQYAPIRNSGHDFGDFVFVRTGAHMPAAASAPSTPAVSNPPPASVPSAPERQPEPAASSLPSALTGCWLWFNHSSAIIRTDGTLVDGPFSAHWQLADAARQIYTITWPKAVDTVTLSQDGMQLSGVNQYGISMSASRIGAPRQDVVGTWRWYNGVTVTIESGGTLHASSITAEWKVANAARRTYNFIWPEPVDTLTLSADSLHLTGGNQYGIPTGGAKIAATCPGMR